MDGARLMNAVVASGCSAASWTAGFDTAWVDFSKGLGAPVGACLAGSRELIDEAWRYKQMWGGSMRQAGIIAAGALYALDHHVERLADDHALAASLARGLAEVPGVELDAASVTTNIVVFEVADARALVAALADAGVKMGALGPTTVRAVTHLDVDAEGAERAVAAVRAALGLLAAPPHRLRDPLGAERRALLRLPAALLLARADALEHLGGEVRRGGEVARRELGLERVEPVHAQPGALADEQAGVDVPRVDALLVVDDVDPPGGRPGELERGRAERAPLARVAEEALLELGGALGLLLGGAWRCRRRSRRPRARRRGARGRTGSSTRTGPAADGGVGVAAQRIVDDPRERARPRPRRRCSRTTAGSRTGS